MRRITGVGVAVATLALLATACGSSGGRAAGPVLHLGAIYPLTGAQGTSGAEEARGAQLAVDLVNQRGGVRGRRVALDLIDVARAEQAPAAMEQLAARRDMIVVGTHGSTISSPASAAAARLGQLLWETGAVGETAPLAEGGAHFFRLSPMGANLGRNAVAFVRDELAPKLGAGRPLRWAVAYADDSYGRAVGLGALGEITARGPLEVAAFPYAVTDDMDALVSRIAAARPDVLAVASYLQDGVALRRATVKAHLPLLASVGTSSGYCMPDFGAALGPSAVGLFASDKPDGDTIKVAALLPDARSELAWAKAQYEKRWHDELYAPVLAGFASTWALLHHVLPHAASLAPADVAAAALATHLPIGTLANGSGIDFPPPGQPDAGENRAAASVIGEWVAPGRMKVVWPPAFATDPITVLPVS
ncbi:MAG: putative Leu/Ile/Val-binding protein 8 [Acidimicrobiales bacterium]|nr:putative Leu/Ile/Val-binding protein 8 [Acidimicrobiales bacterium]